MEMTPPIPDPTAELAATCVAVICRANRGIWPASSCEWRRVLRRLGLRLVPVRSRPGASWRGKLAGDLIMVRWVLPPERLWPVLAHEVAEWLLRTDGHAEELVCPGVHRHQVACHVAQSALHPDHG
jgi:hypothetical protein